MVLGSDYTCTEELQQQIILLHQRNLAKQQEVKDSVTRNEVGPPLNRVHKISQLFDEMPTEVIDHMFNREDIAASSNHLAGFDQVPDYMRKTNLKLKLLLTSRLAITDTEDDDWCQSDVGGRKKS